jgi:hypothetical protein
MSPTNCFAAGAIITMKRQAIQTLGLTLTVVYGTAILWIYANSPKSLDDAAMKAKQTIETTVTRTEVITGSYAPDAEKFRQGMSQFESDNFVAARGFFANADPERRDAKTQFYIAYSYYRQGFGRLSNDDELFAKGLETTRRVIELDRNFVANDPKLKMTTPAELLFEFEEGLRTTASDFNPWRLTKERK